MSFVPTPHTVSFFLSLIIIVLASSHVPPRAQTASAAVPWGCFFHTIGREIIASPGSSTSCGGQRAVFRGANVVGLEFGTFFNNPYPGVLGTNYFQPRKEDLDALKKLGVNVIRLTIEWARLITGWKPGASFPDLDKDYLAVVDEVVKQAADIEIYVVLDMHDYLKYWSGVSAQECVDASTPHQDLLAHTWRRLADHFRENRGVLGFDLMNEPIRKVGAECGSEQWHSLAQRLIDEIRPVDSNHLIIVEGPNYSLASDWQIENLAPFVTDRVSPARLAYSPHVYFDSNNDSVYDEPSPSAKWPYYARDRIVPSIDWSSEHGVPLFVGEIGVPRTQDWADVMRFAFRAFLEPEKVSATVWHYIDPARCPDTDQGCLLNLAHGDAGLLRKVLSDFPGGTDEERESIRGPDGRLVTSPVYSRIFDDELVKPWNDALPGNPILPPCKHPDGSIALCIDFNDPYENRKVSHDSGIDTRRFKSLRFSIYLTGAGNQDFRLYTTAPNPKDPGHEPEYPPYAVRPKLRDCCPNRTCPPETWFQCEVLLNKMDPLDAPHLVNPDNPIVKGIALQNLEPSEGPDQALFYLDNVVLTPFDDDVIRRSSTVIRAVHFTQARNAVDALRLRHEKTPVPFSWEDPVLVPGKTFIRFQHVLDLQTALLQVQPCTFTEVKRGDLVMAAHLDEIRNCIFSVERE